MPEPDQLMDVEVERLKTHPGNPRRGDVDAIAQSLQRFGQVKPLIVQRSTGYIVAGNHTYQAAVKLGWKTVRILVKDLDDEEARGYLIADNRTSEVGTTDKRALYNLLDSVLDLGGTGYEAGDVRKMAEEVGGVNLADEDVEEDTKQDDGRAGRAPMRDITLLMTAEDAAAFGQEIAALQGFYGTRTVVETVRRAVRRALDMETAYIGRPE